MRNIITLCLVAATLVKVAFVLAQGPASIELDAKGYWDLSELVMQGDVLMMRDPIAYRTPAYPWFLAAVRTLAGQRSLAVIVVLQGLMFIACTWLAAMIAAQVTGSPWAVPTTLLIGLPAVSAIVYPATVLTESLFTFLLMLNLLVVIAYQQKPTWIRGIFIGVTFAVTILIRPVAIHLWIAHLVFIVIRPAGSKSRADQPSVTLRQRSIHLVMAMLAVAVLLSPWLIRNQMLFGKPFLTEFLGRNLWIVTFQDGSGAGLDLPTTDPAENLKLRIGALAATDDWRFTWFVSNALVASGLSDPATDRLMRQVSIDAIQSDPGPFAYKTVRRTINYWRCAVTDLPTQGVIAGNYEGQLRWSFGSAAVREVIDNRLSRHVWFNTLIASIAVVSVMALIIDPKTRQFGLWFGLIFGYFSVVTGLVEIPNYRYRIVMEPLVATVIGSALTIVSSAFWGGKKRQLPRPTR